MKKVISMILAVSILLVNISDVNATELNPFEMDRLLYGDKIISRIVIYDETANYINPQYLNKFDFGTYELIPGTDAGGQAFCYKYFSMIEWIVRTNGPSLSLTPKGEVLYKAKNWNSIYSLFKNNNYWKNSGNSTVDSSMENQFACHYDFDWTGLSGVTWDLEPWRTDKGYAGFVASGCN